MAVGDAGPLIHLAEIDSLWLLSTIGRLYLPEIVRLELVAGGLPEGFSELDLDLVEAGDGETDRDELDPGETAALAVAKDLDAVLLTDDLAAREVANETGVEVHGSIGIIALAYARGLVDRDGAAALMRALQRETSLFVTDAIVEHGIELLDDS